MHPLSQRSLEVLYNVTRAYCNEKREQGIPDTEIREMDCIKNALEQLRILQYRQDQPFI